jgi:predicted transcriptional regulator
VIKFLETKINPRLIARRNRIDIMVCMLKNSKVSSTKKRVVNRHNLNPAHSDLYTAFLVEIGLLEASRQEDVVKTFETTEKGKEFLREYSQLMRFLNNKKSK